ncbi:hypothetical protein EV360DRAFT_43259 [Lentinula raphanica]|nr:hypothetical protein EV360DRAFT_43259 [Lentinula raphanica]
MSNPQFNHFHVNTPGATDSHFCSNNLLIFSLVDIQEKLEQKLKPTSGTWVDHKKICLKNTRTTILKDISDWIYGSGETIPQIFFLCGEAGTGKSTISHTIGNEHNSCLGAFFCFDRTISTERTPSNALRTIAYNLGIKFSEVGQILLKVFETYPYVLESTDIQELWKILIVNSTSQMTTGTDKPVLIIIDALDESGEKGGQRDDLLSLFMSHIHHLPQNFRILVTSRPESDIIDYLRIGSYNHNSIYPFKVQFMDELHGTGNDILLYICSRMTKKTSSGSLTNAQCEKLAERAAGFFQWAAIVCTFLSGNGKGGLPIDRRFQQFMNLNQSKKGLDALDQLYSYILNEAFDVKEEEAMANYRSIMAQVVAAFEPLSEIMLKNLQSDGNDVSCVLSYVGSLFTGISKSDHAQIKPVHVSVLDFLLDEKRSHQFCIDQAQGHQKLANGTFHLMFQKLHFNMGKLETSYILNSKIENFDQRLAKQIAPELIYACHFWDLHLQNIKSDYSWVQRLEKLFFKFLLYWIEVLALTRKIQIASRAATFANNFIRNLEVSYYS